jgi:FdhD protein
MATTSSPLRRNVTHAKVVAIREGIGSERADQLATEEPMEIRVAGPGQEAAPIAVTMRTPGGDFELAVGFLFTEGLIAEREDVRKVSYCEDLSPEEQQYNIVTVNLTRSIDAEGAARNFYATSSCGICGKAALEDVEVHCDPIGPGPVVDGAVIGMLPAGIRAAQKVFDQTGGLHAAGLFAPTGKLLALREDVGRHNAVDKIVGEALLAGDLPLSGRILMVSGRISFEIVQKAARAGIAIIAAVSAPSSLAVDAAERFGMTLVGFVREGRFNVYAHPERISGT